MIIIRHFHQIFGYPPRKGSVARAEYDQRRAAWNAERRERRRMRTIERHAAERQARLEREAERRATAQRTRAERSAQRRAESRARLEAAKKKRRRTA